MTLAVTMNSAIQSILNFTKVEHTILSLPLLFAGAYLAAGNKIPSISVIVLILLAGVGARILGMSMNRILDKAIDAQNPRTCKRELVTGRLSTTQALGIAGVGLGLYLCACFLLNPLCLVLSPIPAIVLTTYSLLKRFTPLCHFGIGLSLALAPAGAYLAVTGNFSIDSELYLLSGFTFFWISGFDIIYALQDIAFDKSHGVHSIPAALGFRGAILTAALCHTTAITLLLIIAFTNYDGMEVLIPLAITSVSFICAYLPFIPLNRRFMPISAIAGIGGAFVSIF